MSGTESSIPIGPQSIPQNIREIRITRGERLSLLPIIFGSTKFQKNTWTHVKIIRSAILHESEKSGIIREKATGKNTAIIDPTFGI